jgi:hypothetical protein
MNHHIDRAIKVYNSIKRREKTDVCCNDCLFHKVLPPSGYAGDNFVTTGIYNRHICTSGKTTVFRNYVTGEITDRCSCYELNASGRCPYFKPKHVAVQD